MQKSIWDAHLILIFAVFAKLFYLFLFYVSIPTAFWIT